MLKQGEDIFPIMQQPRLVIYPWMGGFRFAWATFAYTAVDEEDASRQPTGAQKLAFGHTFVDASTGEIFLFASTRKGIETPDTGSGLGVTPLSGPPYANRNLNIVRVDMTSTYRLRDTTHAREIITYDLGASASWSDRIEISNALDGNTLPLSEDTDGNKTWNRLPANTTDAQRTAGQQPEVDVHFFSKEIYEWYHAVSGGRIGWDNNQYANLITPHQSIRALTHVWSDGPPATSRWIGASFDLVAVGGGKFYAYMIFFDGDPTLTCNNATPNDRAYAYFAGSLLVVAHEYTHGITDFSFKDGIGNPGLIYNGWLAAVHEGLSDVFGGLIARRWLPGADISSTRLPVRDLVYPRAANTLENRPGMFPCGLGHSNKDHFADRNLTIQPYDRGTILGHCAFLMGPGGVHQRASRLPALIPIYSMGEESIGGKNVLKAARIWYRALTHYFSTHGALMGIPANDENTFRTLRNACVSAAIDLYGNGSLEHRTTVLAFYAVGLQPVGAFYGADVTFLRWGGEWQLSRPYLGGTLASCPDWASMDLFVNNGGLSEWNAIVNNTDANGNPTQFENNVYCRVRNVGDQVASNVKVDFFYAPIGTGTVTWLPVKDKSGTVQSLNISSLPAGQANFPDSVQNSPPVSASVKWCIPPLLSGITVDHFCLRAVVTCANDVNSYNNEVQSNIAYTIRRLGPSLLSFMVGNPTQDEIPLQLEVGSSLPKGWIARLQKSVSKVRLQPGEERLLTVQIALPDEVETTLVAPFDGEVTGRLFGQLSGPFTGALTGTVWDGQSLQGIFSASVETIGSLMGTFEGRLNVTTGQIIGSVSAKFQFIESQAEERLRVSVEGCLKPWRRVNIFQKINGESVGGFTIQVQVPMLSGPCECDAPPTREETLMKQDRKLPHFEPTKPADIPSEADWQSLYFTQGAFIPSLEREEEMLAEFERRERADELSREKLAKFQTPKWVYAKIARGVLDEEMFEEVAKRIRRAPSHDMHILAGLIINELGRKPEGSRLISELFTQRLAYELQSINTKTENDDQDDKNN